MVILVSAYDMIMQSVLHYNTCSFYGVTDYSLHIRLRFQ